MAKIEKSLLNQLYAEFEQLNLNNLTTEAFPTYNEFSKIFESAKSTNKALPDLLEKSLDRNIKSARTDKERNFYIDKKSMYKKAYNLGIIGDQIDFDFKELKKQYIENQVLMKDKDLEEKIKQLEERIEKEEERLSELEDQGADSVFIKKQKEIIAKLNEQLNDLKELRSRRSRALQNLKNESKLMYNLNSKKENTLNE